MTERTDDEEFKRLKRRCRRWLELREEDSFAYSLPMHRADQRRLIDLRAKLAAMKSRY